MALIKENKKLLKTEQEIDNASLDSFPASDPPASNYPGASLPVNEAEENESEILEHPEGFTSKFKESNSSSQFESQDKLHKQQQELETHLNNENQKTTNTDKDQYGQKLDQVNEATKQGGEIDPAFRLNKNYRKGSQGSQGS